MKKLSFLNVEDTDNPDSKYLPFGRYDFKDNGIYIGEWLDEKALGLGLLTKDKNQGEYTGLWDNGSEKYGVFLWPPESAAIYVGDWNNLKRDGYGIFLRECCIIKGKFSAGFPTFGVKINDNTLTKFEGEFEDGFEVCGVETYADGSTYSGDLKTGSRRGYGVRSTVPYAETLSNLLDRSLTNDKALQLDSAVNKSCILQQPNNFKDGFILSSKKSDMLTDKLKHIAQCKKHRKRGMKRSHSLTSVFSAVKKKEFYKTDHLYGYNDDGNPIGRFNPDFSVKSVPGLNISLGNAGNSSPKSFHSPLTFQTIASVTANDNTKNDGDIETIGADVTEVYSGHWIAGQRNGYGVCERSDGLIYEGAWRNNQRHGYGFTRFPDGTFEDGEYVDGKLTKLWTRRNIIHSMVSLPLTLKIRFAVRSARVSAEIARQKAIDCHKKLADVHAVTSRADESAVRARTFSFEARYLVKRNYKNFVQPGIEYLKQTLRTMQTDSENRKEFEAMLQEALEVVEGCGIPEMLANSEAEPQQPQENLLVTDNKGNRMVSRHGSFRRPNRRANSKETNENVDSVKRNLVKQTSFDATVNRSDYNPQPIRPIRRSLTPRLKADLVNPINKPYPIITVETIVKNQKHDSTTANQSNKPITSTNNNKLTCGDRLDAIKNQISSNEKDLKESQQENFENEIILIAPRKNTTGSLPESSEKNILTLQTNYNYYNKYKNNYLISPLATQSVNINVSRRFTAPVRPHLISRPFCQLEQIDGVLFIIENGIRNKVSGMIQNQLPTSNDTPCEPKVELNVPNQQLTRNSKNKSQQDLRKDLIERSLSQVPELRQRYGLTNSKPVRLRSNQNPSLQWKAVKVYLADAKARYQAVLKEWLMKNLLVVISILMNMALLYYVYSINKNDRKS